MELFALEIEWEGTPHWYCGFESSENGRDAISDNIHDVVLFTSKETAENFIELSDCADGYKVTGHIFELQHHTPSKERCEDCVEFNSCEYIDEFDPYSICMRYQPTESAKLKKTNLKDAEWKSLIQNERLIQKLGQFYRRNDASRLVIGALCDDSLDKSGALLGKVREYDNNENTE